MKLNRKGYMLVEIILASVLAMSIAYYLLNLTYRYKNENQDLYQSVTYTMDRILITKNIMDDLERGYVTTIKGSNKEIEFNLILNNTSSEARKLTFSNGKIQYGKTDENGNYITTDVSYYEKELSKSLTVAPLKKVINNNIVTFTIPISSIYDDTKYDIKLMTKYGGASVLLNTMSFGSYVKYIGNNGCSNSKSCEGKNINRYCDNSKYEFNSNGWRIAYIENGNTYLVSAGAPECIATNSKHVDKLNQTALNYCNKAFTEGNTCESDTTWALNEDDYLKIPKKQTNFSSFDSNKDKYNLISVGGYYWFSKVSSSSTSMAYNWDPDQKKITTKTITTSYGVRPVIKLDSNVYVTEGAGVVNDPYIIDNLNTVQDLSGNMNNGVVNNGNWDKQLGSFKMNGNAWINSGFVKYNLNNFSFVVRVKFNPISTNKKVIFSDIDNNNNKGIELGIENNKIYFQIKNNEKVDKVESSALNYSGWYTIVGIIDNSKISLYINGGSNMGGITVKVQRWYGDIKSDSSFIIGACESGNNRFSNSINAEYDSILLFNHTFNESVVEDYYSSTINNVHNKTNLILYYDFKR